MKHIITSAILLLTLLWPVAAAAFDFEADGICCNITGDVNVVFSVNIADINAIIGIILGAE